MSDVVYLNGQYMPSSAAAVSPFDRGFLFADGVYEVVRCYGGVPFRMADHVARLQNSLAALRIDASVDYPRITDQLLARNRLTDATVYVQVTRGTAPRGHAFPDPPVTPTVFATARSAPTLAPTSCAEPLRAVTAADERWGRCDIKSIALLPNALARQAAVEAGCDEAILMRADGVVTEGTARSVFAVIDGVIRTHPLCASILPGVTRKLAIELADKARCPVAQRPFTRAEMLTADEVFLTGTTTAIRAVREIDQQPIADGSTGSVTARLIEAYNQTVGHECGVTPG